MGNVKIALIVLVATLAAIVAGLIIRSLKTKKKTFKKTRRDKDFLRITSMHNDENWVDCKD